jgi:hypothetical protein
MCYDKPLLDGRRWMRWTMDETPPRSYPATKTSLQMRVCAWTPHDMPLLMSSLTVNSM